MIKGEERRLETTKLLRRMREAFDEAAAASTRAAADEAARIADLEDELRRLAAARTGDHSDLDG
jgi:hypothetical protein